SPALTGMFYPDLLQRFIPLSLLPDRAEYLEDGFEAGWTAHCDDTPGRCANPNLLSQNFLSLWQKTGRPWLPALIIGGTVEETGGRILTSNLNLGHAVDAGDFLVAINDGAPVRHDVRLS